MYIPKNMALEDRQVITSIINDFGFGLLVSPSLDATHLPLIYQESSEGDGYLYGHIAKANRHWKQLDGQDVLAVFSGPHTYISPTWYANRPAVPTWNYVSVHCFGTVEILDAEQTAEAIDKLMLKYEPEIVGDTDLMAEDYVNKLAKAIVGFRVKINSIQAKEKLGQHKSNEDQLGVFKGLQNTKSSDAAALVNYMQKRNLGTGSKC